MQLYNEKVYDMMEMNDFTEHKLRFSARDQFFVEGIKSVTVQSAKEAMYLPTNCSLSYDSCAKRLIVASHRLNASSSRSHAVFTVQLEILNEDGVKTCSSKLMLVVCAHPGRPGRLGEDLQHHQRREDERRKHQHQP